MSNSNITKRAIQESFRELLSEKPLEKITVGDISSQCGLNRNTFYYHYQDIQELLEEMCQQDVERIIKQYPELTSMEECFDAIADFASNSKRVVHNIFYSSGRGTYSSSVWKVSEHVIACYLHTVFPDTDLSDYDRKLIIKYFTCSCFGLMIDWINSGMKDDYRGEIHRMLSCSRGIAELLLSNLKSNS